MGNVGERVARGTRTVRVDRRSPLGNPYVMGSEEERDAVCDAYAALLTAGETGEGQRGGGAQSESGRRRCEGGGERRAAHLHPAAAEQRLG